MPFFVDFDPVALGLGPIKIHWYAIMYLIGFAGFWILGSYRAGKLPHFGWSREEVGDFLFYGALGVVLGGRLGYILLYDLDHVINDPRRIYQIWKGGMSFHGGLAGVALAAWYFARKNGRRFFAITDFITPLAPIGLFFGRIGNFIGGELWGRLTDASVGMIFPKAIDFANWNSERLRAAYEAGELNHHARHPSQLYEAGLEGLVLFLILWFYSQKPRPSGAVSGLFLIGYGCFRIVVEHFREPDAHIGYLAGTWLTMGQILSLPLVMIGVALMVWAYRARRPLQQP